MTWSVSGLKGMPETSSLLCGPLWVSPGLGEIWLWSLLWRRAISGVQEVDAKLVKSQQNQLGIPPQGLDFLPLNHSFPAEVFLDVSNANSQLEFGHINASSDLLDY